MHAPVQNHESTVETACASFENARCVCVWMQEFAAFLSALQPVLERASYAFAKIVLICHGSSGFLAQVRPLLAACQHCDKRRCCAAAAATVNCAGFVHMVALTLPCAWLQVLCGMSQLLAVGQSYGLHLQCFTSTSMAATEVGGQELAQGVHADSWGMSVQHPALHRSAYTEAPSCGAFKRPACSPFAWQVLVKSTARAFLTQWAGLAQPQQYLLADAPTQQELFLTRCGCCSLKGKGVAGKTMQSLLCMCQLKCCNVLQVLTQSCTC